MKKVEGKEGKKRGRKGIEKGKRGGKKENPRSFPDLVDITSVNPDFPVSDPTVFQKRYLKKIRELGEVSGILNSGILGLGKLGKLLSLSGSKIPVFFPCGFPLAAPKIPRFNPYFHPPTPFSLLVFPSISQLYCPLWILPAQGNPETSFPWPNPPKKIPCRATLGR